MLYLYRENLPSLLHGTRLKDNQKGRTLICKQHCKFVQPPEIKKTSAEIPVVQLLNTQRSSKNTT